MANENTEKKSEKKGDPKNLFKQVDGINAELLPMEKKIVELQRAKSALIGQIVEVTGTKGPFVRNGKKLKAVRRALKDENKEETGEVTWYFRGETEEETVSMD